MMFISSQILLVLLKLSSFIYFPILLSLSLYAQEQSEWVFPTGKARAHDASVTLVINNIYFIITQRPNISFSPSLATTLYLLSLFCQYLKVLLLRFLQPSYWLLLSTDSIILAAGLTRSDRIQGGLSGLHKAGGRANVSVPRRTNHSYSAIG